MKQAPAGSGAMFDDRAPLRCLESTRLVRARSRLAKARRARSRSAAARVADVATGTGDVAIRIARAHPDAHVVAVDPSPKMLEVAAGKIASSGWANGSSSWPAMP
jgi:ubiquinone/menaquinone biosynthesis C-methylase UbiE